MWDFIKSEPVAVMGLIQTALALGVSFGLHLSTEQVGAIMAFSSALFALVTRQNVYPISSVVKYADVVVEKEPEDEGVV